MKISLSYKFFFLQTIFASLLYTICNGQLYIQNPSFEGIPYKASPPSFWKNCPVDYPLTNDTSTIDIQDSLTHRQPTDGHTYIGLVAYSSNKNNESCSGELLCGSLKQNIRYKFSIDVLPSDGAAGVPAPLFKIWWGEGECDTSQLVFSERVSIADSSITGWHKLHISFNAKKNFQYIILKCQYIGPEDMFHYTGIGLDNLSPVIPDTVYNSTHTPIKCSNFYPCAGDAITLTSPYGDEPEQYWYANGIYIGQGVRIVHNPQVTTQYTVVLGKDSCVRSVLQCGVSVECGDANELLLPDAYTPNYDGQNDYFHIINSNLFSAIGYKMKGVQIFSRWGNVIYKSEGDWGFKWNGSGMPLGVYFYIIHYINNNNKEMMQKGSVTLIR